MTFTGPEETVIASPQWGLSFLPDGPISFLRAGGNVSVWFTAAVSSYHLRGPDFDQLEPHAFDTGGNAIPVLGPSGSGFDQGHAGAHSVIPAADGVDLLMFYHAEDHAIPSCARFGIGLARSSDGGVTWTRMGQVISSQDPFVSCSSGGRGFQGAGNPTATRSPDGQYLYLYFADLISNPGPDGDAIHLARAPVASDGAPGTWEKYSNGSFSQPGLGGSSSPVLTRGPHPGSVFFGVPSVSFNAYLNRYVALGMGHTGVDYSSSIDGIAWDTPNRLWTVPAPTLIPSQVAFGESSYYYPTFLSLDQPSHLTTGRTGYLYVAHFIRRDPDVYFHYMARRPVVLTDGVLQGIEITRGPGVSVTAVHPLGLLLSYAWTASCPDLPTNGVFANRNAPNPGWTPPVNSGDQVRTCVLDVTVTDGQGLGLTTSFNVQVFPEPPALTITTEANGTPNPVASNGLVNVSVTAESSRDYPLSYAWTASCPTLAGNGSFTSTTSRTPTWTAPDNQSGTQHTCTISVTVNDGHGLTRTSAYVQAVSSGPPAGVLEVTPGTGLSTSGIAAGVFFPNRQTYTLRNTGTVLLAWSATRSQPWVTLSATGGTLDPGATTTVTVSIDSSARSLPSSITFHTDDVVFTNTTNGRGDSSRRVTFLRLHTIAETLSLPFFRAPYDGYAYPGADDHVDLPLLIDTDAALTHGGEMAWGGRGHGSGYDIGLPVGAPVLAIGDGIVVSARARDVDCPKTPQLEIGIVHRAPDGRYFQSQYAHLSRLDVHDGEAVVQGQVIGLSGDSGCSGGPHLHFAVLRDYTGGLDDRQFHDDALEGPLANSQFMRALDPYGWFGPGPDPFTLRSNADTSIWLWMDGEARSYREERRPVSGFGPAITAIRWLNIRDDLNPNNEFVEIAAPSGDPGFADLTGFRLRNNRGDTYEFPAGTTVSAGRPVRVYTGPGENTDAELFWGRPHGVWDNFGDCAHLVRPDGTESRVGFATGECEYRSPRPGTLQLLASDRRGARGFVVTEGAGSVRITVFRTGGSDGVVSATVSTRDGTARAGVHYLATSQVVTFADGDTGIKIVEVPIADDAIAQRNGHGFDGFIVGTFSVDLGSPTGGATLGAVISAPVTIFDNEVVRTLTVTSNIAGGAAVGIHHEDVHGLQTGVTPYTRTYVDGTHVEIVAPRTVGTTRFRKWLLDGAEHVIAHDNRTGVTMLANHALTAIYGDGGTISSVSPGQGPVGTVVTLTGSDLADVTAIRFGDVDVGSFTVLSPSSLRVVVPAGATTGPVTAIWDDDVTARSASIFKVTPKIVDFLPANAAANGTVTISGFNLRLPGGPLPTVRIGAGPVTSILSATATEVVIQVPLTAFTGRLSVTTADGTGLSGADLVVVRRPTITSFSPAGGAVGATVSITGTNLTGLTGAGFFNGAPAAITPVSATSVRLIVPQGAMTGPISVTNAAGQTVSLTPFKVTPRITGFTPASALTGASVTITGTTFTGAIAVKFGSVVASFIVDSDGQITAVVPTTAFTGKITVTTSSGTFVGAADFVVIRPPTVTSFTPAVAPVGGSVTLTGTHLSSASDVHFNGVATTPPTILSAASLRVAVPAGATTGPIRVFNPAGSFSTLTLFKVLPRVTGFTPASGLIGASVTITGTTFTGATAVRFGTATALFNVDSDSQVTAAVPATAFTGKISVTTPGGTGNSTTDFVVIRPPTVTSFTPAVAPVSATVTLNGTHLSSVSDVHFNGVAAAPPTILSAASLRVTVPAGATTGRVRVVNPAGNFSTVASFKVLPRVTGFMPVSGLPGASITITGTTFAGATAVKFGAVAAAGFTVDSDGQITATVPATAFTGKITVTTPAGDGVNATDFVVIRPPTVTSFTPATAPVGATVTLTGTHLVTVDDVRFNGVTAAPPTILSAASLRVTVPAGATAGPIRVVNPAGNFSTMATFKVLPRITGLTPTGGLRGVSITITGTTFTGTTAVKFGAVAAGFTVDSDGQLTATVPATALTGKITVTTPAGAGVSASDFVVIRPPTVTSFTPAAAPVGATVTLTGTHLVTVDDVRFNGVSATPPTILSAASLRVTVPAGASTGPIRVVNPAGNFSTVATFKVLPRITGLTPTGGLRGASVTITGTTFTGAIAVKFGAVAAGVTVDSDDQITTVVPATAVTGKITVTTPSGTSNGIDFTVVRPPTITSFSPAAAPVGASVTLNGTHLDNVGEVHFNGVHAAPPTILSVTSLRVTVPAGASTGPIRVVNPAGNFTTATTFRVLPRIAEFAPTSGLSGASVTITGTTFTGATTVTFGSAAANFTVDSDTQITAVVPPVAVTGRIAVTTPTGVAVSATPFAVVH